jgi:hypothetical protein
MGERSKQVIKGNLLSFSVQTFATTTFPAKVAFFSQLKNSLGCGYGPLTKKSYTRLKIASVRIDKYVCIKFRVRLKISNYFETGFNEIGCRPKLRQVKSLQNTNAAVKGCKSAGEYRSILTNVSTTTSTKQNVDPRCMK